MTRRIALTVRLVVAPLLLAPGLGTAASAQTATVSRGDSALVLRMLSAEDRRTTSDAAIRDGMVHPNARIRLIAKRAAARIGDPGFTARDSMAPPTPAPRYTDAPWRTRYRALGGQAVRCDVVRSALTDSVWAIRLRAADVATAACASDPAIMGQLERWAAAPPSSSRHRAGEPGWHASAHALVALARIASPAAKPLLPRYTASSIPWLRMYAARAAGSLGDTTTLRSLAADANDNVREAAIDALSKLAGHSSDDVYLEALTASSGYQVIRAAARALKGSPRASDVTGAARSVLVRLRNEPSETSRDARVAVGDRLKEFGDSTSIELLHRLPPVPVPPEAVALALGRDYRLRVTLADSSGGGSFIVRLRGDIAPIMAARVLSLVRAGWYNGRTWYRVEPDFVIQGGGPGSNEYVGHPRYLRDELSALPQVRGTVGMSTRGHDTGDAQWFINLKDNQRLTRDYTTFGEITDGIGVVDRILEGDVIARIEMLPAKPHD